MLLLLVVVPQILSDHSQIIAATISIDPKRFKETCSFKFKKRVIPQCIQRSLPHRKIFFASRVMSIQIFDDYRLMYDNDVIIETVFVQFDLLKVDNTYLIFSRLYYINMNNVH